MERERIEKAAAYHMDRIRGMQPGDIAGLRYHNKKFIKYAEQLQEEKQSERNTGKEII